MRAVSALQRLRLTRQRPTYHPPLSQARDAKDDARAQGGATDAEGETTETVENGGLVETVGATEAARTADAGPISSSLSEKTALLQARCDELEVEATAAAEKVRRVFGLAHGGAGLGGGMLC